MTNAEQHDGDVRPAGTSSGAGPQDLEIHLPDRPGALADLGQALGEAGVSLEGGGVFTHDGHAVAHYLVHDGARALRAVRAAGLGPAVVSDVVLARLDQEIPGQLGTLARRLGDAGVNVRVQYSDHVGNLVLLVADDELQSCREAVARWGSRRRTIRHDGSAVGR